MLQFHSHLCSDIVYPFKALWVKLLHYPYALQVKLQSLLKEQYELLVCISYWEHSAKLLRQRCQRPIAQIFLLPALKLEMISTSCAEWKQLPELPWLWNLTCLFDPTFFTRTFEETLDRLCKTLGAYIQVLEWCQILSQLLCVKVFLWAQPVRQPWSYPPRACVLELVLNVTWSIVIQNLFINRSMAQSLFFVWKLFCLWFCDCELRHQKNCSLVPHIHWVYRLFYLPQSGELL